MADKNIYWSKTALTGGGASALDSIDGTGLQDGEIAHVWVSDVLYVYRLDVDSAAAESSPNIIAPDANAGDKRWILQPGYIAPGAVVQVVNSQISAVATGNTALPYDDTIPQNTEGDEYITLAITPKSATNILLISFRGFASAANATISISAALFQDATAGALAAIATWTDNAAGNATRAINLDHKMTAGTTSSTTFKIRIGSSSGSTVTLNGVGGGRLFGGVAATSLTITEIKV